jgi:hypothetical protein
VKKSIYKDNYSKIYSPENQKFGKIALIKSCSNYRALTKLVNYQETSPLCAAAQRTTNLELILLHLTPNTCLTLLELPTELETDTADRRSEDDTCRTTAANGSDAMAAITC